MLKSYLPILVFAFLGLTVGGAFVMLNYLVGPKRPTRPTAASRRQGEAYESGIPVLPTRGIRFGVSFYLIAMLFILFDIEVVFVLSWAVVVRKLGMTGLIGMLIFLAILEVAHLYAWKKGALEWE